MHEMLEKLRGELSQSVEGLSNEGTQMRRAVDKWTIQQIVEHLTLSYAKTYDVVAARVAKGTPTKGSPSFAQRMAQFAITSCGIFPKGHAAPAAVTPMEVPLLRLNGAELASSVSECLLRMDGALRDAEGLFGSTLRSISHMRLGPMSVHQWRRFHLVHGEHHLKQILASRRMMRGTFSQSERST